MAFEATASADSATRATPAPYHRAMAAPPVTTRRLRTIVMVMALVGAVCGYRHYRLSIAPDPARRVAGD